MSDTVRFDLGTNPIEITIEAVALLLTKITTANDKIISNETSRPEHSSIHKRLSQAGCTCFHARSVPSIDIRAYLLRISRYCPATNEVFLSLLIYFDRMSQSAVNMRIDSFNIHRLIISGITVASKLFSDTFFTNTRYAKVGGLPVAELNNLELEFLHLNDFDLYISVEELQEYGDQLLKHWYKHEAEGGSSTDIKAASKRKLSQQYGETNERQSDIDHDARKKEAEILKSDTARMRQLSIDDGTGTGRRRSSSAANPPTAPHVNLNSATERQAASNVKDKEQTKFSGHLHNDSSAASHHQPATDGVFVHSTSNHPGLRGNIAQQFT